MGHPASPPLTSLSCTCSTQLLSFWSTAWCLPFPCSSIFHGSLLPLIWEAQFPALWLRPGPPLASLALPSVDSHLAVPCSGEAVGGKRAGVCGHENVRSGLCTHLDVLQELLSVPSDLLQLLRLHAAQPHRVCRENTVLTALPALPLSRACPSRPLTSGNLWLAGSLNSGLTQVWLPPSSLPRPPPS